MYKGYDMKKKLSRIIIILGLMVGAFATVMVYAGKEWFAYLEKASYINEIAVEEYKEEKQFYVLIDNIQSYFYGGIIGEEGREKIYVIMQVEERYLVVELDYEEHAEAVFYRVQQIHKSSQHSLYANRTYFYGSLQEMENSLMSFIMDTQGVYLGEKLEEQLISYVFIPEKIGSYTFNELRIITGINISIAVVGGILIILCLIFPRKKKNKKIVLNENDENEKEETSKNE